MQDTKRFFVFTGGPGSGKTTLIHALKAEGFHAMPEAGRSIIKSRLAKGLAPRGEGPVHFADMMLAFDARNHEDAQHLSGTVLFDRAAPDLIGYLRLMNETVSARFEQAARRLRYNRCVFLAPHWPAIYRTDTERDQQPDEAIRTEERIARTYLEFGYEIRPLPLASISERVDFVKQVIGATSRNS